MYIYIYIHTYVDIYIEIYVCVGVRCMYKYRKKYVCILLHVCMYGNVM